MKPAGDQELLSRSPHHEDNGSDLIYVLFFGVLLSIGQAILFWNGLKMKKAIVLQIFATLLCQNAFCRWETIDEQESGYDDYKESYEIHKDGTVLIKSELVVRILKESGRSNGTVHLTYDPRMSRLKVIKATTTNGNQILEVASDMIDDKAIGNDENGFDRRNQITVAFPDVKVGSVLSLKTEKEIYNPPISAFFSDRFSLEGILYKKYEVSLTSELPLHVEISDPENYLEIGQSSDKSSQKLSVKLKRPIVLRPLNEIGAHLDISLAPWVAVSTDSDYRTFGKRLSGAILSRLKEELPKPFDLIREAAATKGNAIDQANEVTSRMSDQLRYTRDYRTVAAGYIPRTLNIINDTKFGDCKDVALVAAAILRKLGFNADLAAVERGAESNSLSKIPLVGNFNHIIVRAEKDGQIFWIDPTNSESFAQGVPHDILDRDSLVLDSENIRLEHIPAAEIKDSIAETMISKTYSSSGTTETIVVMSYAGRAAADFAGADLSRSKKQSEETAENSYSSPHNLIYFQRIEPDLSSRVVRDIQITDRLTEKTAEKKTSLGLIKSIATPDLIIDTYNMDTKDRVSDFFIGPRHISKLEYTFNNIVLLGASPSGCDLKSKWLDVSLNIKKIRGGVRFKRGVVKKVSLITNADLKSAEFKKFQNDAKRCFEGTTFIFKVKGPIKSNALAEKDSDSKKLPFVKSN